MGGWQADERHGFGVMKYSNGDVYQGDFRKGDIQGQGTKIFASGRSYKGAWVEGRREGFGTMTYPDGETYVGEYLRNRKHGNGKITYANGSTYEGTFVANKRQGKGVFHTRDKKGRPCSYRGPFDDDLEHGHGVWKSVQPGGWVLEKEGMWIHGRRIRWVWTRINEHATRAFLNNFKLEADSTFVYGMSIAEMLPRLPPGVDPRDPKVIKIVNDIVTFVEQPVIGLEMEKKTRKELEGVKVSVQDKKDYAAEAKAAYNEKLQQIEEQEDIVAEERDGFEEEEAIARKLRRKISAFWAGDKQQLEQKWKESIAGLNDTVSKDW